MGFFGWSKEMFYLLEIKLILSNRTVKYSIRVITFKGSLSEVYLASYYQII